MRHIIYARAKADVEISAPDENYCAYQKIRHPSYAPIRKLGAQTLRLLTIWARQNLQLLTSSKSGWRALVQVMSPLVHVDLKWSEDSGRPALWAASLPYCTGCCNGTTCQNICALSKYLRAYIFTISWEKVKNLSRLLSVLSLHRKFVHDHNCCPNSATILTDS